MTVAEAGSRGGDEPPLAQAEDCHRRTGRRDGAAIEGLVAAGKWEPRKQHPRDVGGGSSDRGYDRMGS
jgi:hypothetical protein